MNPRIQGIRTPSRNSREQQTTATPTKKTTPSQRLHRITVVVN
jgi:hypothetical protein